MRSRLHGGSQTNSTSALFTSGMFSIRFSTSPGKVPATGQAGAVRVNRVGLHLAPQLVDLAGMRQDRQMDRHVGRSLDFGLPILIDVIRARHPVCSLIMRHARFYHACHASFDAMSRMRWTMPARPLRRWLVMNWSNP